MNLQVTNRQLALLEQEARRVNPIEACGLLFGELSKESAIVKRVIVTPNVLKSSVSFEIETMVFHDSFTKAKQDGHEFLGFFHSHPASADPSSVDIRFMKLWGDAVWLILSSIEDKFAAFRMENGKVRALHLRVEGKP
jgi:proteasome lid subunit RPN8/RPN11